MKLSILTVAALAALFYSCHSSSEKTVTLVEETGKAPLPQEIAVAKSETRSEVSLAPSANSATIARLKKLSTQYRYIPFYTIIDSQTFVMVSDAEEPRHYPFTNNDQFGLVDDSLKVILPVRYDKIYNPNATLLSCFEIKKDGKIGLFNYRTKEILDPRFDFILPGKATVEDFAYGYRSGQWYKIHAGSLNRLTRGEPSQEVLHEAIAFDNRQLRGNLLYEFYPEFPDVNGISGHGSLVIPSYAEHLYPELRELYPYMFSDINDRSRFTEDEVTVKIEKSQSLYGHILSFFTSVLERGVDVRDYYNERQHMVLYHSEKKTFTAVPLTAVYIGSHYQDAAYRLIGDSIVEVKSSEEEYRLEKQLYHFETQYRYLHISPEGEITPLTSDRHFDFTQFTLVDESHFQGHFARRVPDSGIDLWESDHLSVEDLDIMRNEIYAAYGYRFKSPQWHDYFSQKPWYLPRYDNVDDQLTALDKANIEVILRVRKAMVGQEQKFTHRRKGTYFAAG